MTTLLNGPMIYAIQKIQMQPSHNLQYNAKKIEIWQIPD